MTESLQHLADCWPFVALFALACGAVGYGLGRVASQREELNAHLIATQDMRRAFAKRLLACWRRAITLGRELERRKILRGAGRFSLAPDMPRDAVCDSLLRALSGMQRSVKDNCQINHDTK